MAGRNLNLDLGCYTKGFRTVLDHSAAELVAQGHEGCPIPWALSTAQAAVLHTGHCASPHKTYCTVTYAPAHQALQLQPQLIPSSLALALLFHSWTVHFHLNLESTMHCLGTDEEATLSPESNAIQHDGALFPLQTFFRLSSLISNLLCSAKKLLLSLRKLHS